LPGALVDEAVSGVRGLVPSSTSESVGSV
jgi:hypothetical protein